MDETEIKKRLSFIASHMIDPSNQSYILGKDALLLVAGTPSTNKNVVIPSIVSYPNFISNWTTPYNVGNMNESNVYQLNGNAWQLYDSATAATATEFNFTKVLTQSGTTSFLSKDVYSINETTTVPFGAGAVSPLLDLLNALRVTYNLLDEATFSAYKAKLPNLSIAKYSLTASVYETVTAENVTSYVSKIIPSISTLDNTTSNIEAIRSVLKGYETIIHVYIAMFIRKVTTNNQVPTGTLDSTFVSQLIDKFGTANDAIYTSGINNAAMQLMLTDNISKYNSGITRVNDTDTIVTSQKEEVSKESINVANNSALLKNTSYVYYSTIAAFIVVVIILGGILATKETKSDVVEAFKLKSTVAVILVLSTVAFVALYSINNNVFEQFDVFPTDSELTSSLASEFVKYLEIAIYKALITDTNMRYGDINQSLKKQVADNENTAFQLKIEKETLHDTQADKYHTVKDMEYQTYLFLEIVILASIATFAHLYTSAADTYIAIVFTLLLLFVIYVYVLKTNSLVHTDASKIYWKQPSLAMLN